MLARIGVGLILTRPNDDILLGHRIKDGEPPTWCFPGGHVEAGESFERAALRELNEEAGILLKSTDIKIIGILQNLNSSFPDITGAAIACLDDNNIVPQVTEPEIFDEWRWFSPLSTPKNLFPATVAVTCVWKNQKLSAEWKSYKTK